MADDFSARLPEGFRRRMRSLLGADFEAFLTGYDRPLSRGLRVNTLKISVERFRALFPLPLATVPFSPDGFAVPPDFKAGADPLHHAGAYYMQEPSAMSAVTVLAPQPGERVLDLCAAPGGKSTQIAAALGGSGLLWSNEYVRSRAQILLQNLERCGVTNAVVSSTDVHTLAEGLPGWFDAVLVDAPCSGEGMFRKEPAALEQWSEDNIRLCAARQREILDAAAMLVRPGGRLVYSTCTFAPEENECRIAAFLAEHPEFVLEDCAVPFGRPAFGFDQVSAFAGEAACTADLTLCRRILPDDGGEGHFIARLRRAGDVYAGSTADFVYPQPDTHCKMAENLYAQCFFDAPHGRFVRTREQVRLLPEGLPRLRGLGVLAAGTAAAEVCRNRVEPCHAVFMAHTPEYCRSLLSLPAGDPAVQRFLRGETLSVPDAFGWTAAAVGGVVMGFGKASGGVLKNRYPKGLRLR